jgi:hypothetical protein
MSQTPSAPAKKSSATLIRQLVLIGLLILVGAAAVYDRKVARPACDEAYDKLQRLADERIASRDAPPTNEDVKKAFGKEPSQTENPSDDIYLEKYTWLAGLPFRSYYIWVVYTPRTEGAPLFQVHFKNEEVPKEFLGRNGAPPDSSTPLPGDPVSAGTAGGGRPRADNQTPPPNNDDAGDDNATGGDEEGSSGGDETPSTEGAEAGGTSGSGDADPNPNQ